MGLYFGEVVEEGCPKRSEEYDAVLKAGAVDGDVEVWFVVGGCHFLPLLLWGGFPPPRRVRCAAPLVSQAIRTALRCPAGRSGTPGARSAGRRRGRPAAGRSPH